MTNGVPVSAAGQQSERSSREAFAVPKPSQVRRRPRFWQLLTLLALGACVPPDLYAANLFFIGCPLHRVLDALILHYLLNVSLVLVLVALTLTLVAVPLSIWQGRVIRARDALFGDE
jgi:hypothetical protein